MYHDKAMYKNVITSNSVLLSRNNYSNGNC